MLFEKPITPGIKRDAFGFNASALGLGLRDAFLRNLSPLTFNARANVLGLFRAKEITRRIGGVAG